MFEKLKLKLCQMAYTLAPFTDSIAAVLVMGVGLFIR